MEKLESMLTEIFDARIDNIASVTKEEREQIKEMKNLVDIEEFFPEATKKEIQSEGNNNKEESDDSNEEIDLI